jgi:ribosomal protein S18 acetylase RimI-like enzyme
MVALVWSAQHAVMPLTSDPDFMLYRLLSPLPFSTFIRLVHLRLRRIVGFGACGRQRDERLAASGYGGEIGALYILRAHQHRGIGRALMAALARALAELGHDAASLWVLRENAPARAFYEALGGEIVGEKSDASPGGTLVELAYGWRDLSRLTD